MLPIVNEYFCWLVVSYRCELDTLAWFEVDKAIQISSMACQCKLCNSPRFNSINPPTQWNLRDVRWSSAEKIHTNNPNTGGSKY